MHVYFIIEHFKNKIITQFGPSLNEVELGAPQCPMFNRHAPPYKTRCSTVEVAREVHLRVCSKTEGHNFPQIC